MLLVPKENGAFTARAYLTAQAPDTGLADNAEELGVVGVLVTDVLNRGLFVMADIAWVPCSKRPAALTHVRLLGPWAARLGAGPLRWAVSTDPAAHLDAALILLSLLPLARAVPTSSTLGQRSM
jgi:hypothetical protein